MAKLGMKIQAPRKTPYDSLSKRMTEGRKAQQRLEIEPALGARGTQRRLPRVAPIVQRGGKRA